MNEHDIAGKLGVEFADDDMNAKFATVHKMTAKRQRELFGYNVFNRQSIAFYFDEEICEYVIDISKSVAFGMDRNVNTFTCAQFAGIVNTHQTIVA